MSVTAEFRQVLLDHMNATTPWEPTGIWLALFTDAEATVELVSPDPDLTDPENPIFPTGYYRQLLPLPDFDEGLDTTFSTDAVEFQIVSDVTVAAVGMCSTEVVGTADVIMAKVFAVPLVLTAGQTVRFEAEHLSLKLN